MNYQEAKVYLDSFINYEKKSFWPYKESLKLERLIEFLKRLDNPHQGLNYLHIAGTKGKGSVCAFCAYILRSAGYRVGLYTSPHLSDFRERIRILNPKTNYNSPIAPASLSSYREEKTSLEFEGMISENEACDLVERLKPSIEEFNRISKFGPLSFFEVYTTVAFVYFREKRTDFVVLEAGLGGRLDATNVVLPLVCGITPISYDHTEKLGSTLKEIATEEAGIIKDRSVVISSPQESEAQEVIRKKCKVYNAKLYEVGKDIFLKGRGYDGLYQNFDIWSVFSEYQNLKIRLIGEHQIVNAATSIGTIEPLRFYGIFVSSQAVREGLINTFWPGRLEVVSKDPLVILDGAQNSASAKVLKIAVKNFFNYKRLILILGISKDKDIRGIGNEILGISDLVILTKADNPRACEPKTIRSQLSSLKEDILLTKNSKEAIEKAKLESEREDLILVTGSLFLVGEVREYLKDENRFFRYNLCNLYTVR